MHSSKSVVQTSQSSRASLKYFFFACRPKTLSAAIVPVVVGGAVVNYLGFVIRWPIAFCILLSALLIQIGTNLFNDALDFDKGADTHTRLGPRRATHMGWFTSRQLKLAATGSFFLAAIVAIPLVLRGGWPIVVVGMASLVSGYLYTGGPRPLAYSGLGDLFVLLFFGVIAVMGTVYLLTGRWLLQALIAGIQVGALSTVLIAINNYRDMLSDLAVGKMTLPARFGARFAKLEIVSMFLLAFGLLFYWQIARFSVFLLLFIPSIALTARIIARIWSSQPSEQMNRLLHLAALTQMTFALALTGLLIWGVRTS